MTKISDGGPAFPNRGTQMDEDLERSKQGMSLRDWFAGQAMGRH